ncbi:hypothetical protein CDAR_13431 [Caerostris darwini]|uniref:Uncharacterized protein n=1 Tax=Caerostris darwini TaxID=1538125 RepID=A0AAV4UDV7_9ARAC|nr:hypothetical protein CDAR_13431 [Caerostris darwini]
MTSRHHLPEELRWRLEPQSLPNFSFVLPLEGRLCSLLETELNSLSHCNPSKTSMRSVQCMLCRMSPRIQEVSALPVFVNVAGFLEVTSPEGNLLRAHPLVALRRSSLRSVGMRFESRCYFIRNLLFPF